MVENPTKGLTCTKIEGKLGLRVVQNADITLDNVFVPDFNRLAKSKNFQESTNAILKTSRMTVAWIATGISAGAYEAAVHYCTQRKQFGKPIAQFQLV